jgi:hypothetical protein
MITPDIRERIINVNVILRPTVSLSVYSGVRPPSRTRDQFFLNFHEKYFKIFAVLFLWATHSGKRTRNFSFRHFLWFAELRRKYYIPPLHEWREITSLILPFFCCYAVFAFVYAEPLSSNCCYVVSYLVAFAYGAYMPYYVHVLVHERTHDVS